MNPKNSEFKHRENIKQAYMKNKLNILTFIENTTPYNFISK